MFNEMKMKGVTRTNANHADPTYTGEELQMPCFLKELKYLVVGTGRCGSVYAAKLLSSVGLPCTHEAIFQHDGLDACLDRLSGKTPLEVSFISKLASLADESRGVNWFKDDEKYRIVAESSYMAAPYLDHPSLANVSIIHIVRHPLKVINSFVAGFEYFNDWCLLMKDFEEYHKFIYGHVPELYNRMSPVVRCALYWIRWNQMIEEKSKGHRYFLYRVEHDPSKLFSFLRVEPPADYYKNKRANEKLGLSEVYNNFDSIPEGEVKKELMEMYNRYYGVRKSLI
jgi:hypothetical protein